MPVLNHHIIPASDSDASARYLADTLGFEAPVRLGHFAVVKVGPDTTLDFITVDGDISPMHYAFLVTEGEFDEIFDRIKDAGQQYWSDPMHADPGRINHWDDGRGVYFADPDGHNLEILTRPYGSAGTSAQHVHPLVAPEIDESKFPKDVH